MLCPNVIEAVRKESEEFIIPLLYIVKTNFGCCTNDETTLPNGCIDAAAYQPLKNQGCDYRWISNDQYDQRRGKNWKPLSIGVLGVSL